MKATSVIYLKPTNSQGIKSQTHYGFMFPFECLSTPGVYKNRGWQILKEKVIFTFTCRRSTNVPSKMSSLPPVSLENRYQLADEDIQYTVLSPFHFHIIPTTRRTNLELFSKSSHLYSFVLSMECLCMFIHDFYYDFNGVFTNKIYCLLFWFYCWCTWKHSLKIHLKGWRRDELNCADRTMWGCDVISNLIIKSI